ncbi:MULTISPECIES: DUF1887 family CARF protein [Vibrio]|uniref:Card1 endonuclease domain-containing protein n=1 Tax=Vibrio halioticoli NBRC 102217 TaxID=1219072 RepID=V5FD87_9VIBR|nr:MULTISPECIES: DUF1887 family CARF protein [Vibrio]MPW36546.1 DUF1887 family protein [Vibrio sp. B1Z05]GAD89533.1 hypothetical protein VHA01S_021_00270 [Vibrio halioticoli NBRC 102217]
MKKYLMTWYGMTDFRASLGLERTTGPVLGALLAEDYTNAVILGFTHPDKRENKAYEFQQKTAEIEGFDSATVRKFLDLFSNTAEAHNHFNQWLQKQLRDAGKTVDVHFHPVELTHLNDTEGIYEAATQSLNTVAASEGEKLATLYLSPGTPVMAFVWAFAALRHPTLKKRLIASSQPGRPPESVLLPKEWMEWHAKAIPEKTGEIEHFDAIFHLFGEQRMPSLLGINQFQSQDHVFVNSTDFPANVMKQFIAESGFYELSVDPYDPEKVKTEILNIVEALPSNYRIGFNLTGGTKLMYAGALAACRKVNGIPFYFDNRSNKTIFLDTFYSIPTKTINSVSTFIQLNGNDLWVSKHGDWEDIPGVNSSERDKLTSELWLARSKISKLYKHLVKFNDSDEPFNVSDEGISAQLLSDRQAEIKINNKLFKFEKWPNFARYLSGGWFEEYTYRQLEPLLNSGLIKDLKIGLEVSVDDGKGYSFLSESELYQELDITFTDGRSLYVVECKAGGVKSDQIMKLQNIVRYFGGMSGHGILACCFSPKNKVVRKKIEDSSNIHEVAGSSLQHQIKSIVLKNNKCL